MKMCQAFAEHGHQVTLFVKNNISKGDDYEYYGVKRNFKLIKVPLLSNKWISAFVYLWKLKNLLQKTDEVDIYYSRYSYPMWFILKSGKSFVLEVHDIPHHWFEKRIQGMLFGHPCFSHLVVISRALGEKYRTFFPDLQPQQIVVAHDGADGLDDIYLEEKKLGGGGALKVGYVGSLYEGRGMDILIELAKRLADMEFHIIGGTAKEVTFWKQKAPMLKNLFFHGYVAPKEVPAFQKAMDILVAPYQKIVAVGGNKGNTAGWMSPLKIFEYMSAGKAIVVSDLPTIQEILENEREALLVPAHDTNAWQRALEKLKDVDFRRGLGENAKIKFFSEYTWQKRAQTVIERLILVGEAHTQTGETH
jgi:glycosyltransferase involved in cell wall biosynthesis